jgi:hypothetical protein
MKKIVIVFAVMIGLNACDGGEGIGDSFNRTLMLTDLADNLIIPSYNQLQTSAEKLEESIATFTNTPSLANLETAQQDWITLYTDWQWATAFNFGPAGEEGLQKSLTEEIGTFPVSESKLQTILENGTFNLNDFNRDARGIFALEYLLFNVEHDQEALVAAMVNENRKSYSLALIQNIKTKVETVHNTWTGSYKTFFVSNNGSDAGSSTSELYNEFVKSFEGLKNFKVALPLGLRAGQTQAEPTKVEAYYSGQSITGIRQHWLAIKSIWYGTSRNGNAGTGFYEYLKEVAGGEALIKATEQQLATVDSQLALLSDETSFSRQIETNKLPLESLSIELQRQTRYFKSDLSSLIGIAITFASGDGD